MPNRTKLDMDAVKEWALAHGFEMTGDDIMSAPYGEGRVQIELLKWEIRVTAIHGEHQQRLIRTFLKHLHIDENDMLHGAGLFSRFYTNYRDDYREHPDKAVMPVWFGEKVQAMIAEHVASENVRAL